MFSFKNLEQSTDFSDAVEWGSTTKDDSIDDDWGVHGVDISSYIEETPNTQRNYVLGSKFMKKMQLL